MSDRLRTVNWGMNFGPGFGRATNRPDDRRLASKRSRQPGKHRNRKRRRHLRNAQRDSLIARSPHSMACPHEIPTNGCLAREPDVGSV
jgi:hypothetical protein